MCNKSVVKEWTISYAFILLVPLITIFANYFYNANVIRTEIMQAQELILDNLGDSIDRLMDVERERLLHLYVDDNLIDLAYSKEWDAEFYVTALEFTEQLASYKRIDGDSAAWIYMEDKDYIFSGTGANVSHSIYNAQKMYSSAIPDYEEWIEFQSEDYYNEYFFYDGFYQERAEKHLVHAHSYYCNGTDKKINIFVMHPISVIEELTESLPDEAVLVIFLYNKMEESKEQLLVVNSSGVTTLPEDLDNASVIERDGLFQVSNYVGVSVASGNGKAAYALLVPQEIFWRDARYIRNVHLTSVVAALLIGIVLVTILVKRNFKPLSQLIQTIGSHDGEGNEFKQIEAVYGSIQQENSTIKKRLEKQKESVIASYLLSLLKGRITQIGDWAQEIGLDIWLHDSYYALIGFWLPVNEKMGREADDLSFFLVDNIFSELMEKEKFYRIEEGRFLYYLFCIEEEDAGQWSEKCMKNATLLCELLEERFQLSLAVVVGTVEHDISRAEYMYQSVKEAFEYMQIVGGDNVISVEGLRGVDKNGQLHTCHVMIVRALEDGSYEEAFRCSQPLFHNAEYMSFAALRLKVLEAFHVVVECYNKYITDSVKRMQLLAWLDVLLGAENAENLKKRYDEMLLYACSKIGGQQNTEDRGIVQAVLQYIENNYTDYNLNVSSVADAVNRNFRYVSKIFKEETGEGILDYINNLRIRKAQELLLTTDFSVDEVSERVGYASSRTFRRQFAKIVGIPPGSYQETR